MSTYLRPADLGCCSILHEVVERHTAQTTQPGLQVLNAHQAIGTQSSFCAGALRCLQPELAGYILQVWRQLGTEIEALPTFMALRSARQFGACHSRFVKVTVRQTQRESLDMLVQMSLSHGCDSSASA